MLLSVNGAEVRTLESARAILLGDKGSRAELQMCRSSVAADGRVEYARFRVSLLRGDAKFFLALDTKRLRTESQVAAGGAPHCHLACPARRRASWTRPRRALQHRRKRRGAFALSQPPTGSAQAGTVGCAVVRVTDMRTKCPRDLPDSRAAWRGRGATAAAANPLSAVRARRRRCGERPAARRQEVRAALEEHGAEMEQIRAGLAQMKELREVRARGLGFSKRRRRTMRLG